MFAGFSGAIFAPPLISRAHEVPHLPRLLKILRVVGKYRLDEFLVQHPGAWWIRLFLTPYRIGAPSSSINNSKSRRLRLAMEELGPIYIKFGQLLSTRRDFLDKELADELQSLQDNVPPFTSPPVESIVEEALGLKTKNVFTKLDSEPFASASVAQVHKAKLLGGEDVVVKVIRPGIEKTIRDDIHLLKWLADLIENNSTIGKRLRPIEVVNDYEKVIYDELNLQAEAANTSQLRNNFENSPVLYVPKVYWDYTRKNVLVMERIHGIPVTDISQLNESKVDFKKLAETGVDIFFTQVFEHNFFHADMHPGNIFVSRENPDNPQYIAIDCAIIGSLTDDDQTYLAKNLLAIFKRDYRRVAELHVECGWVPENTKVHEFESAMRTVCEPIFEKPLKDISFGQILVQLFQTAGRFNMEVQPSLVLLQKTLLNIEGLGRQLYPELDLWKTALPYLEHWNTKRLNPLTLLEKTQENIPNYIEQLPHVPFLLIKAIEQSSELHTINESIRAQQKLRIEKDRLAKRHAKNAGIIALVVAGATLIPAIGSFVLNTSIVTLGLTALGLYLLSFKR